MRYIELNRAKAIDYVLRNKKQLISCDEQYLLRLNNDGALECVEKMPDARFRLAGIPRGLKWRKLEIFEFFFDDDWDD